MRKVYLEDLPKHITGGTKGKIDWKNCNDKKVKFIYDDIEGEFTILDYNSKERMVNIIYKDEIISIRKDSIFNGQIGDKILKNRKLEYLYSVEDIVNNDYIVMEKTRITYGGKNGNKAYVLKCLIDNHIFIAPESHLNKRRCPVCTNHIIIKGINDIATTHPHLVKYFVNIEDAYKYGYSSGEKINAKCPLCDYDKDVKISNLVFQGFSCDLCSFHGRYPEKFIFKMLQELNNKFIPQYCMNNKRYDFYIENKNIIIETHGMQHYENAGGNWKSLEEEQKNDKIKKDLALENGIDMYIIIDCRYSELEWIKRNILNSKLPKLLDFKEVDIDWLKCHEFALSSRVKEVYDLWNSGIKSTTEIGKIIGLSATNIIKYLKHGEKLDFCDYTPEKSKSYISIQNGKKNGKEVDVYKDNVRLRRFSSCNELSRLSLEIFGIKFWHSRIIDICNGKSKYHKGYSFKYVEGDDSIERICIK